MSPADLPVVTTASATPAFLDTLTPSPRPTLHPTITVTSTPLVSLYNRYIGKDEKRQPESAHQPEEDTAADQEHHMRSALSFERMVRGTIPGCQTASGGC